MTEQELMEKLATIKNGSFFRIAYKTNPPVNAIARRAGTTIQRVVTKTVRTGVKYMNITSVKIAKEAQPIKTETPPTWHEWVVPGRIAKHKRTGEKYLAVYPTKKGTNTTAQWYKHGKPSSQEECAECIIPSYFSQKQNPSAIQYIKLSNIIEIY